MAANKEFIVKKKKSLLERLRTSKAQPEWTIWDELDKLRMHIIRSLAVVSVAGIIFFCFQKWLFTDVVFAPAEPGFITYRISCVVSKWIGAEGSVCLEPPVFTRLAIGFGEPFIISIQVSFLAGLLAAFPYVLLELGNFVAPLIPERQRKSIRMVVIVCSLLFYSGVAFGYYLLAPVSISWLMGFTIPGVDNTPTLSSYINYMIIFTLPMGLIFQVPMICYFLARIGLLSEESMRAYRRHTIVGILLAAGIITPTVDGLTQVLVAFPLYLLFEGSIFIVARGRRLYEAEEAD